MSSCRCNWWMALQLSDVPQRIRAILEPHAMAPRESRLSRRAPGASCGVRDPRTAGRSRRGVRRALLAPRGADQLGRAPRVAAPHRVARGQFDERAALEREHSPATCNFFGKILNCEGTTDRYSYLFTKFHRHVYLRQWPVPVSARSARLARLRVPAGWVGGAGDSPR